MAVTQGTPKHKEQDKWDSYSLYWALHDYKETK